MSIIHSAVESIESLDNNCFVEFIGKKDGFSKPFFGFVTRKENNQKVLLYTDGVDWYFEAKMSNITESGLCVTVRDWNISIPLRSPLEPFAQSNFHISEHQNNFGFVFRPGCFYINARNDKSIVMKGVPSSKMFKVCWEGIGGKFLGLYPENDQNISGVWYDRMVFTSNGIDLISKIDMNNVPLMNLR